MVINQRGNQKWVPGRILKQKGPVSYLVRVGSSSLKIRYCHVDHLLKSKVVSLNDSSKTSTNEDIQHCARATRNRTELSQS